MNHPLAVVVVLASLVLLSACGDRAARRGAETQPPHPLLADADEVRHDVGSGGPLAPPADNAFSALAHALGGETELQSLVVAQPSEGEELAGDDQSPRFLWRDPADAADTWWVGLRLAHETSFKLRLLVRGDMPAEAALDPLSMSLHAWTPSPGSWSTFRENAARGPVVVRIVGFAADAPDAPLSSGSVTISIRTAR